MWTDSYAFDFEFVPLSSHNHPCQILSLLHMLLVPKLCCWWSYARPHCDVKLYHIFCRLRVVSCLCIVQGTSSDQDNRFSDKSKRLMKTMKFADAIARKVKCVFYLSSLHRYCYLQWFCVIFLADRTIGRAFATGCRLSICLSVCLSVTFCILAKRCILV